jgi:serine/threonine-protein kinase RsbW
VTAPLRLSVRRSEVPPPEAPGRQIEISLRVPTDLGVVEEAVDLVARHCLASGIPPRAARFRLRVALCEALSNAIVYGNQMDPAKRVDVTVVVTDTRVSVQVRDEGNGFNPSEIPDPTSPDRLEKPNGRGLFLIRQLVDEVRFNERGNSICMILHRA